MKKTTLLLLLACGLVLSSQAQPFQIGHTTITFNDPARTGGFGSGGGPGRQIQSEVYYPALTPGTDVAVATGDFPVIVFGHGFVMAWDAYQNIWDELVPEGYIMVFPRTEGGFSPSHSEFGLDLAHLVGEMQSLNTDNTSLFYTHVTAKTAIMGHSMGGGASFLAAENNTSIETVIGLAPAETTPSAIGAAPNVSVPALVLSGSSDGVTPPVDHHLPIYNGLGSNCKYFVSATGGAHCYFANTNFNCDFGEGTSSSGISISRAEQHAIMFNYIKPWLAFKLKSDCQELTSFQSSLTTDPDITYLESCNLSAPIVSSTGGLNICQGDSVELFSSSVLDWNQGSNGSFIYASATGDYYGYDSNCQISNTITITVNSIDSIDQNVTICSGDSFTVGSSTYTTTGDYFDSFTNMNGCDSVVHTQLMVNSSLNPNVSISGDTLTVNLPGLNYQWLDCDNGNMIISGENNVYFVPSSSGNYAVLVSTNNCSDTSNCIGYLVSSEILDNEKVKINIYPNPSNGEVFLNHPDLASLVIFSSDGKIILQENGVLKNLSSFNLKQGVYFIKTITTTGEQNTQKLIIAQ